VVTSGNRKNIPCHRPARPPYGGIKCLHERRTPRSTCFGVQGALASECFQIETHLSLAQLARNDVELCRSVRRSPKQHLSPSLCSQILGYLAQSTTFNRSNGEWCTLTGMSRSLHILLLPALAVTVVPYADTIVTRSSDQTAYSGTIWLVLRANEQQYHLAAASQWR
jgi:hypothetical protein